MIRAYLAAVNALDWLKLGLRLDRVFACGISGVDVRVATPHDGPSKDERELVRLVSEAGLAPRCHAWAGVRAADGTSRATAADGDRQGRELARCAQDLGVTDLASGNFERDVWRGPGGKANPKAVDFIDAYISAFYEANRNCWLGDLGFADPSEHYVDADLDRDGEVDNELPEVVVMRFRRRGIMAYGSTFASVRAKLDRGRAVAGEDLPLSWWGSVGRLTADGSVVGDADVTREIVRERYAGIDEWVGYVGYGAIGQVLDGNPQHPPLVTLVAEMSSQEHSA